MAVWTSSKSRLSRLAFLQRESLCCNGGGISDDNIINSSIIDSIITSGNHYNHNHNHKERSSNASARTATAKSTAYLQLIHKKQQQKQKQHYHHLHSEQQQHQQHHNKIRRRHSDNCL